MKKEDLQRHIETQLRNIMCADVDIGNCIDAAINKRMCASMQQIIAITIGWP